MLAWLVGSVRAEEPRVYVLSEEVHRVHDEVAVLAADRCVEVLQGAFDDLERLRPSEVDPADLRLHGADLVREAFAARLALHEDLRRWVAEGTLTRECMTAARRADLAGRYLEDYVIGALPAGERPPAWLVDPRFGFEGPADLRSGDVLVTRANALSSAGIAHMGRVDSQFSHNVVVYVDPKTHDAYGVMAYLEQGMLILPIDEFLGSGVDRVVVLRHPDAALAARAGAAAYDRVRHGRRIDYDADFDYDDHAALFCSEVPRWAYGELVGLPDSVPIPAALTVFEREKNAAMFRAMGIPARLTSAPADILYDPTFDVVAEWRNVDDLVLLRRYDAVVESVMRWMEDLGYALHPERRHRTIVSTALFLRRLPLVGAALKAKIHPRGDKEFLVASLALQDAAMAVRDDLYAALSGAPEPTTYDAMREALEAIRADDLARWQADPRAAHFTALLHP